MNNVYLYSVTRVMKRWMFDMWKITKVCRQSVMKCWKSPEHKVNGSFIIIIWTEQLPKIEQEIKFLGQLPSPLKGLANVILQNLYFAVLNVTCLQILFSRI